MIKMNVKCSVKHKVHKTQTSIIPDNYGQTKKLKIIKFLKIKHCKDNILILKYI